MKKVDAGLYELEFGVGNTQYKVHVHTEYFPGSIDHPPCWDWEYHHEWVMDKTGGWREPTKEEGLRLRTDNIYDYIDKRVCGKLKNLF